MTTLKTLLAAFLLISLGTAASHAKTMKIPNEDFAIASIDFPDSWEPEEASNGVSGNSPDKAVYMSVVAVGSDKGMQTEIDETFAMLKEHKVELDQASKKENKFKVNGLDAEEMLYQGKDEDGPTAISITFIPVKDKLIILTYWVTTSEEAKHQQEVGKIINSLKAKS